jgi:hypothetical protein
MPSSDDRSGHERPPHERNRSADPKTVTRAIKAIEVPLAYRSHAWPTLLGISPA